MVYRDDVTTGKKTTYFSAGGAGIRIENNVISWTHKDHLGSPVAETNASGNVSWREQYTPYGDTLLRPAANANKPGFTGHTS